MQTLNFGNCCGQTLDFPFVFFFSVFVTQLTTEGPLLTHCCWKGKLPTAVDVVDSDSTHVAVATDSGERPPAHGHAVAAGEA